MTDAELIQLLGGPTALAKRLGYELPDGARRVHNWMKRGIPAQVRLSHQAVFKIKRKTPATVQDTEAATARRTESAGA